MNAQQYYINVVQSLINRKAYRPADWEARGNVFDPECQIIIGTDRDSQEAARVTLERYGDLVMAAHVEMTPHFVSVELVFSPVAADPVGFYNNLPVKMPTNPHPRCAAELVPPGFSGFIHIPSAAKSWNSVNVVSRTSPFGLEDIRAFVGGSFEVYGVEFQKRRACIYLNGVGRLINLPVNTLATAFVADHRPELNQQLVGDALLTFGRCCERRR